jgi:hypothetical protein
MRKFSFLLACSFVLIFPSWTQQIIENPEKLLAKNAGRAVTLKEVLKITDEGTDQYYFKSPSLLHIAPDSSIYVLDRDQLLQFDQNGKFIRNYFKKGQGPGELSYISDYLLTDKNIIIHNTYPSKIVIFDNTGALVKDFAVRIKTSSSKLLAFCGNNYFFITASSPSIKGEEGVIDQPQNIVSFLEGAEVTNDIGAFPIQTYIRNSKGGGSGRISLNKFITISFKEEYLFISHTPEYLVKLIDMKNGKVIRVFSRKYERVKPSSDTEKSIRGGAMVDGKLLIAPAKKFVDDIVNFFVHDNELWVATSTKDKDKGVLIDVYNYEGTYTDSFYMKLPARAEINVTLPDSHVVSGDFLYAIEKNTDATYAIKKYKIGG